MAMNLQVQTTPFGSFTTINLATSPIYDCRLETSYSHPTRLSFKMAAPQHTFPLGIRNFVRFWDDAGTNPATGAPFSSSAPNFEGFIDEVNPGSETNEVEIVCYDPTKQVSQATNVMSLPWVAGTVPTVFPAFMFGAYPRLTFNCTLDSDDDYPFCRAFGQTVQQILQTVLDDQYHPLYWYNAAPGDGSSAGNGSAYATADLSAMTYQPQEKEAFESESIRSVVERLLRYYPRYKLLWRPGDRKWRFQDIGAAPAETLTLNQFTGVANPVLSLSLQRSLEGRYTSVRIYGPEALQTTVAQYSTGGLSIITSGVLLQTTATSCCNVDGINRLQITDPDKRLVSAMMPQAFTVRVGDWTLVETRVPQLEVYYPNWSGLRPPGWVAVSGWTIDRVTGIISMGANGYIYRFQPNPVPGNPQYEVPTDFRFTYAIPANPLTVRSPTSGFSGTAYTVAGLANEKAIYDEMLAVGYEWGQPVTTVARTAQYQILADRLQEWLRDIIHTGTIVLDGIDYRWAWLNKRVNIAAVDQNGAALTIGWESIGGMVTDVEYDFEERTTTIQISSDKLQLLGEDNELQKRKLHIVALAARDWINFQWSNTFRPRTIKDPEGFGANFGMPIMSYEFRLEFGRDYYNPNTGQVQAIPTGQGL